MGCTQNKKKHVEHQNATDIQKKYFLCFSDFYFSFIYEFLNNFSKKCWVTALVQSMTFIGCLNQFLSLSKPHSFSTFFGEERKMWLSKHKNIFFSKCLLRCTCFCVVLWVSFCTGHSVMVPLNLTCLQSLQHSLFEHLFNLYLLSPTRPLRRWT